MNPMKEILDVLCNINYEWYIEKVKFFQLEPMYNDKSQEIFVHFGCYTETDDETGEEYEAFIRAEETRTVSFVQYCWNSYFETSLATDNETFDEDGPIDKYNLPMDIKPVIDRLFIHLDSLLKVATNLDDQIFLITESIDISRVNLAKSANVNSRYAKLKEWLVRKVEFAIRNRYAESLELYNLLQDQKGKKLPLSVKPALLSECESFTYINANTNADAIKDVFSGLRDEGFICNTTKLSDFRKVFENKAVQKKIRWLQSARSLGYFIKLCHVDYKMVTCKKAQHWITATKCFSNPLNKAFTPDQVKDGNKPPVKSTADLLKSIARKFT
jgi:hypothetical protein